MPWNLRRLLAGLIVCGTASSPAFAVDVVMGRSTPQSVLDPHYTVQPTGVAIAPDIFDRLVRFRLDLQLEPGLALSRKPVDDLTWELKLRPEVSFHDGSAFDAEDVAASIRRAGSMPESPSPMSVNVGAVDDVDVVDPLTVRIKTTVPTPLLMDQIGQVFIIPSEYAEATTADFNSGKAMIGTGPYKFVSWVPNERVEVARFDGWWGGEPEFEKATMQFITEPSSRVAALLSGQVDVVDTVPPADVQTLEANPDVDVFSIPSVRLLYLHLDLKNDNSPFVTDKNGDPLSTNPLKDARVRKALSLLIDRQAITDRILGGGAAPAGQVAVKGQGGFSESLVPDPFDPERARALLAEAGYPDGFGLTLHCAVDRDVNSPQALQAVAQMFARGGIKVNAVDCQPYSVYSGAATQGKYSVFLWGRNDSVSDVTLNLRNGYMTFDKESGFGSFNRGRYSNPDFDGLVKQALQEFDQEKRYGLLRQASEVMLNDTAVIPVYFLNASWAAREGFSYDANMAVNTGLQYVHYTGNN